MDEDTGYNMRIISRMNADESLKCLQIILTLKTLFTSHSIITEQKRISTPISLFHQVRSKSTLLTTLFAVHKCFLVETNVSCIKQSLYSYYSKTKNKNSHFIRIRMSINHQMNFSSLIYPKIDVRISDH